MPKVSKKPISNEKLGVLVNNLWSAFTLMENKDDIKIFFRSLFTHTEYKMLAKRLEVARRLIKGDHYESISRDLNVSQKTISLLSNVLSEKGEGFIKADKKLSELEKSFSEKRKNRQDRIERRSMPKMPGSGVLSSVVLESVNIIGKTLTKASKRRSAKKDLNLY